jgi:hypothetical protein
MTKFLTGENLENTITDIIWEAKKVLLIVSPYIKLDDFFKKLFEKHLLKNSVHIIIVFGKNEGHTSKSLSKEDFSFFSQFLYVSVIYVPNLHAKYYGNEKKGVVTSINLYDKSFQNNIEYGIFYEGDHLSIATQSPDNDAWNLSMNLANNHEAVFIKRPVFEKESLNLQTGRSYIKSEILHDNTNRFYSPSTFRKGKQVVMKMADFPDFLELEIEEMEKPTREKTPAAPQTGYCIRTGKNIPFNPKRPLCEDAFISWVFYNNPDWPENYCHKTGKKSFGKTSMRKPIL